MSTKLFLGGMPTDIDVRKLLDAFPSLQVGDQIPHDSVESATGLKAGASRYRVVVSAWRRKLARDHNIDVAAVPGVGFKVLSDAERVDAASTGIRGGVKKVMRSARRSDAVQTEDHVLLAKQDTIRRFAATVHSEFGSTAKKLQAPSPQEQMPKLSRVS